MGWRALEAAGIDRNTPVTLRVTNLPLRRVLELVCDDAGGSTVMLISRARDGTIVVMTADDAARYAELRLYDVDDTTVFKQSLEELLVELRHMGAEVPPSVDLRAAERRMEERARAIMEAEEERRIAMEERRAAPERREIDPEVLRRTGRNDPCPCGSGKKFKKCHGA